MADLLATIEGSNIPHSQKSAIRRWADSARSGGLARLGTHARSGGHVIRQGGEALIVGAALGAIKAERAEGLDVKKVPIDAVAGALCMAASVGMAGDEVSTDLRNAGGTALGIFAYRKTDDYLTARKAATVGTPVGTPVGGTPAHGDDIGEDPIVKAAKLL